MSWTWAFGIAIFALGLACGAGLGLLLRGSRRRARELEQELDELRRRFDGYREQVNQHFLTTSELVQKMTDSYRDVYEHLARGSEALCRNPVDTPSLDFTRQAVLEKKEDETAADEPEAPREFSDAETDPLQESENDSCLGDAPNVPRLETEEPINPRTL